MIVFDLRCASDHVFEAWFASSAAFEEQRSRALVRCPICDNDHIDKAVMAPNIAAKGNRAVVAPPSAIPSAALAALAEVQAKMLDKSEWVGRSFPDRARAMHLGDEPSVLIHGETSLAEARELVDEGVPIAPLPFRVVPPSSLN
ncbi:DUF1178 family protein [Sphingomonas sp. 28-63-12]|uniref:DUF1178 family protein n=1 Tax=Sphingomonas sp. 28-63-12 TaxID=1970434 RepID=UPI000BDCFACD|nr:MAG: hypothetical protein B7Y47_04240 [Sphingomonas sp. 28-63-12]